MMRIEGDAEGGLCSCGRIWLVPHQPQWFMSDGSQHDRTTCTPGECVAGSASPPFPSTG